MRFLLAMTVFAALFCSVLSAGMTEEQQAVLLRALEEMSGAPLPTESRPLCEYVMRDDLDIGARLSILDRHFSGHAFTEHLGYNLDAHLQYSTADNNRLARFSGALVARSIRNTLAQEGPSGKSSLLSLTFLETILNRGPARLIEAAGTGIQDALAEQPLGLVSFLTAGTPVSHEAVTAAMQTCLTLGAFLGDRDSTAWLETPPNTTAFFERARVWLFDGGGLMPEHLLSLESVLNALPRTLHGLAALHLPEVTGISVKETLLRVPGTSMDLSRIGMDVMRNLPESYPGGPTRSIPEFTALAMEGLSQAVQTRQFNLRPHLYQRVKAFFTVMAARPDPAFTTLFPPNVIYRSPEDRMAYLGYLWLADSRPLLETAINQAEQQRALARISILLLVADLYSELGDTTLLFKASPTGMLISEKTALRRAGFIPGAAHVNGIAVGGQLWQYDLGDQAGTTSTQQPSP